MQSPVSSHSKPMRMCLLLELPQSPHHGWLRFSSHRSEPRYSLLDLLEKDSARERGAPSAESARRPTDARLSGDLTSWKRPGTARAVVGGRLCGVTPSPHGSRAASRVIGSSASDMPPSTQLQVGPPSARMGLTLGLGSAPVMPPTVRTLATNGGLRIEHVAERARRSNSSPGISAHGVVLRSPTALDATTQVATRTSATRSRRRPPMGLWTSLHSVARRCFER